MAFSFESKVNVNTPLYIVDARAPLSWNAKQILDGALRVAGSPSHILTTFPPVGTNVILACGTETLRKLVPDAPSAQEARGYIWDTAWGRVIASMSPEDIVTDWTPWRALFDFDLRRALGEIATGCPPLHVPEVTVVTNMALGMACEHDVLAAPWCGADIENTHEFELACMGFAASVDHAYVVPAGEKWQVELIRRLCEDAHVRKVFQNGQYDRLFLARQCGIEVRGHAFDTQLAWHCLPGSEKVDTLAGEVPIAELAKRGREFWTWSWKNGKPWPAKATAFKTRKKAPLVRVKLLRRGKAGLRRKSYPSDKDYSPVDIVCTPEHRFLAHDGRWVEARDLKCGAGLTRIHFSRDTDSGRLKLYFGRKQVPASHYVLKCLGIDVPHGKRVHHIDEQPWNDAPENLEVVTPAEHTARHANKLWTGDSHRGKPAPNRDILGGQKRDEATLLQLYTTGLSVQEIGDVWGCHGTAVLAMMKRYGIERRSLSESQQLRRAKESNCRVLSVEVLDETTDVYCLNVPETGCFSTQGVIVHNSLNPELAGKKTEVGYKKAKSKRTAKSLKFLVSIYTRAPWYKEYSFTEEHERYLLCGKDCAYTLDIANKQAAQLESA